MTPTVPAAPTVPELPPRPLPSPSLVLKVRVGYDEYKGDSLYDARATGPLPGVTRLLADYGSPPHSRAITSVTADRIVRIEAGASAYRTVPDYQSLTRYWRIDVGALGGDAAGLREKLGALTDEVDLVYLETPVRETSPLVDPDDDTPYGFAPAAPSGDPGEYQKYLEPGPVGVNARAAWALTDGSGVGFADIEQQWYDSHEDLDVPASGATQAVILRDAIPLVYGLNRMNPLHAFNLPGFHGTAVLGIVLARDNTRGCIGLAPKARSPVRLSYWLADPVSGLPVDTHVADAILEAIHSHLQPGDVLLLEVEKDDGVHHYPVEYNSLERDAIKLAVASGIVVIEPAGNGSMDLSTVEDPALPGKKILDPASADYDDSGAIVVGASTPIAHTTRDPASNYGARVNCFAWGASVRTTGDAASFNVPSAYGQFANTSAASAILAGVAILVQSAIRGANGTVDSPAQIRALLSNPALGTDRTALGIGVMPDLGQVLSNLGLNLLPDVYLRDTLADTGAVPSTGVLSASPDIIVRTHAVADPTAAFCGQNADTTDLGEPVLEGRDHVVYVRMKNRGPVPTGKTTATVYWSPPTTLVLPDLWNKIGTTTPLAVPTGDVVVVTDALVWPAAKVPPTGHYCFVAILDDALDPAPPLWKQVPGLTPTWDDFVALVGGQNNVAWRNFNVVPAPLAFVHHVNWLPFLIPGAFDADREFSIEILSKMPAGSVIWLQIPHALASNLKLPWLWQREVDKECGVLRVRLPVLPRISLGTLTLVKGARHDLRLGIQAPEVLTRGGFEIAVRQIYKGAELGRVSWRFAREG